jgi:BirA family biotin operon repressor/biotin-[acetyl-CoA-carboxylase] ligase
MTSADLPQTTLATPADPPGTSLGTPRIHFRLIDSTNERARALAARAAPHGTLVTASEQSAGRGRQGRVWTAPPGRALLCSLLLRDPPGPLGDPAGVPHDSPGLVRDPPRLVRELPRLLPLAAGVAVAELVGDDARVKWPNDVLLDGRKVAGILVEGRPQERWAVLGIGLNVAVREDDFPVELCGQAGTLGLSPAEVEPTLARLLDELHRWLAASPSDVLAALRERDALRGRHVRWAGGEGEAAGIDGDGRLVVVTRKGRLALDAGEVHLDREAGEVHTALDADDEDPELDAGEVHLG